jgi:hypothetical protein
MKYLLLFLTSLTASAQLAIINYSVNTTMPGGNLTFGWTNANPAYPFYILATADLKQPSTNWNVLYYQASNVPAFTYPGGGAAFLYKNFQDGHLLLLGLHDQYYTISTNYTSAGYITTYTVANPMDPSSPIIGTNTVYQYASTNYTTNYNCFIKLYQPIPPPVSVNQAKPFECFTAGLFLSKVIFRLRI